jgi:HSP20 family molecular chaperone IbpA
LIVLKDNSLVCATREYNPENANRTILAKVSLSGDFEKILTLPSSGDTSYAGMLIKDGILYISYYSSHEGQNSIYTANSEKGNGKSSIYLAKVWADRLKQ